MKWRGGEERRGEGGRGGGRGEERGEEGGRGEERGGEGGRGGGDQGEPVYLHVLMRGEKEGRKKQAR